MNSLETLIKRVAHDRAVPMGTRHDVIHVGIDIVSVQEVRQSLDRFGERYVRRVFTEREAAYCGGAAGCAAAERFAARYAAKEATLKALRPDALCAEWRSIEVVRHASGWCEVVLHGEVAALAARQGVESLALSMSHHAGHAAAIVVAQVATRPGDKEL